MKKQIRAGVFETNSSSVHSIVFNRSFLEPNKMPMKDGYIQVPFGVFDCSGKFTTQSEKLSYIVTSLWYAEGYPDVDDMYDSYAWSLLEEAMIHYVDGCKGVRIKGKVKNVNDDDFYLGYGEAPYIDHQSIPSSIDDMIVDVYSENSIIDFVFNPNVWLECSRD